MVLENIKQSKVSFRVEALFMTGLIIVGIFLAASRLQEVRRSLDYNATHTFSIGGHEVMIETKSFDEEGPAKVIVSSDHFREVLDSLSNQDLYMDVRPASVSWKNIDGKRGRDLLIWIPDGPTGQHHTASVYLSSGDGTLHTLIPPLQRQL